MRQFSFASSVPAPPRDVFTWHLRDGALRRLLPPWKTIEVVSDEGVVVGGKTALRIYQGPFATNWIAEHVDVQREQLSFKDRQIKGPFKSWDHTHRVAAEGVDASTLEDDIEYRPPFWAFGAEFADRRIKRRLTRQFRYRHETVRNDLLLHQKYAPGNALRVAITGSNGVVGSQLVNFLTAGGHTVFRLVPDESSEASGTIQWDYQRDLVDRDRLEGLDAVVHLGADSVLSPRWSRQKKMEIIGSRVRGTEHLATTLASLEHPPRVFLSASAIGFYGNRDTEILDESSPPGDDGFLSAICQDAESVTEVAAQADIRTVQMRIGIVLSPAGGILSPLIIPFKLGLGGRYGGRHQYLSWIGLDDVLGAVYHLISEESVSGPVNLTSPNPVTMTSFAKTLGRVLSRPIYVNMPPWLVRLLLGEVADDAALMSVRALPGRLEASGYRFLHPNLEGMLRHVLGRS